MNCSLLLNDAADTALSSPVTSLAITARYFAPTHKTAALRAARNNA